MGQQFSAGRPRAQASVSSQHQGPSPEVLGLQIPPNHNSPTYSFTHLSVHIPTDPLFHPLIPLPTTFPQPSPSPTCLLTTHLPTYPSSHLSIHPSIYEPITHLPSYNREHGLWYQGLPHRGLWRRSSDQLRSQWRLLSSAQDIPTPRVNFWA